MTQKQRIVIVAVILTLLTVSLVVYQAVTQNRLKTASSSEPQPGMISLFKDGVFLANVVPADLVKLPKGAFTEPEKGKSLKGWWLRDIIGLYTHKEQLGNATRITLSGFKHKRGQKTATLTWEEVMDPDAHVMLHPAQDGQSLKLVSTLDHLDTRDEWVQGVMQIDMSTP